MNTDDLVRALAADVPAVRRHALEARIAAGVVAGAAATGIFLTFFAGFRPDLDSAVLGFPFWMKWVYTISLGLIAVAATVRLARPEPLSLGWLWAVLLPVLPLAGLAAGELQRAPNQDWMRLWLGGSWLVCPWYVLVFALPIFAGLIWALRRLAPTRLRAAGAMAGAASGAWGAVLYCLHCREASALFVLSWYSAGVVLAAGLGALLGPRLLRW